jgi:putative flippase GtrA
MKRLVVLARSMLAGGAATIVDLAALAAMVSLLGIAPRVASIPALALAGTVSFLGNRHFAFRAANGDPARQAKLFLVVHLTTLALNAIVFDVAIRALGAHVPYWALRMAASNVVYLAWSFPMLRRVFRVDAVPAPRRQAGPIRQT